MIVIAIIWVLAAVLFPNFLSYQQKSRDVVRITWVDVARKAIATYLTDEDIYPNPVVWCVPDAVVIKYNDGQTARDKVLTYDNWCGPNGNFGYGTGREIAHLNAWTDEYVILARLEFQNTGNYSWGLVAMWWYTGSLTAVAFGNSYTSRAKQSGDWYVNLK